MSQAIATETVEQDGQTFRIAIYHDADAPNPLEEWDEMGTILSLNRRHVNFDPDGIDAAIESNPDAVPLSYFEHGLCLWSVAGELPAGARCPFDSVVRRCLAARRPDAGIGLHHGGRTRWHFTTCRQAEAYTALVQRRHLRLRGRQDFVFPLLRRGAGRAAWKAVGASLLQTCRAEARAAIAA